MWTERKGITKTRIPLHLHSFLRLLLLFLWLFLVNVSNFLAGRHFKIQLRLLQPGKKNKGFKDRGEVSSSLLGGKKLEMGSPPFSIVKKLCNDPLWGKENDRYPWLEQWLKHTPPPKRKKFESLSYAASFLFAIFSRVTLSQYSSSSASVPVTIDRNARMLTMAAICMW